MNSDKTEFVTVIPDAIKLKPKNQMATSQVVKCESDSYKTYVILSKISLSTHYEVLQRGTALAITGSRVISSLAKQKHFPLL